MRNCVKGKREWFDLGCEGPKFIKAVQVFEKMLAVMEAALVNYEWLAGDSLSLTNIGVLPYVNRLAMFTMLEKMTTGTTSFPCLVRAHESARQF